MENRRPIRIQKKENILRLKNNASDENSFAKRQDTDNIRSSYSSMHAIENSMEEESSTETLQEQKNSDFHSDSSSSSSLDKKDTEDTSCETSSEKAAMQKSSKYKAKKLPNLRESICALAKNHMEKYSVFYFTLMVSILSGYFFYKINNTLHKSIDILEERNTTLKNKVKNLETLLHSKHKEVDMADYLEGARIIHDLTTKPFFKNHWLKPVKGLNAEVAIDRVCTKHHCYSFKGSEGKLAIAFKNEKLIRKIGIIHPLYDNRNSAVKKFTVDCLVNNEHVRVGEFEYEIPGDSFQQFSIPLTKCTGIIFKIHSNHGNKQYTCIYKVYAFE